MLMLELMTEAAKRYGSGPGWIAVVNDAGDQARRVLANARQLILDKLAIN